MTNRTASLLMLFVAALVATGLLLAIAVNALDGSRTAGPWLAPTIAVLSQVTMFYLGRRFILPPAVAQSGVRSAVTVAGMVIVTLGLAVAVVWLLQRASGRAVAAPTFTLLLWFALLWVAVRRQNWHPSSKTSVR